MTAVLEPQETSLRAGEGVLLVVLEGEEDRGGYRREAFSASGKPHTVGSRGTDRDGCAAGARQGSLGVTAAWRNLRAFTDHLNGNVADREPRVCHEPRTLREKLDAGRAGPLGAVSTEHRAEVAEPRSRQQRIAARMRSNVAVAVTPAACGLLRPLQPGQSHRSSLLEGVHVDTDPDARDTCTCHITH